MKQAKKIFTRLCLNNWGGVSHKVLEFNEYVNLFSGKSGSGKSTVMDAIQVLLYGSFSSSFLNKAADDAKNKRSVLSYLRGEQKDGTANRENVDFCSTIVLEIKDTGTQSYACAGIAFEVKHNDSEIKKYTYFSHAGKLPESEYINAQGYVYTNQEIRTLLEVRARTDTGRGRDINHTYASREAYLAALYDIILGYIDGTRFQIMEKSAIALKMTNGTGQFIRDYMFPKSESNVIEKISDQLGSYKDIQDKIKDMHHRIELLGEVREAGNRMLEVSTQIARATALLRCLDVVELQDKIAAQKEQLAQHRTDLENAGFQIDKDKNVLHEVEEELIQVKADLQASDLGAKKLQLEAQEQVAAMLTDNSRKWHKLTEGLRRWEEDEAVTDYVSNPMLQRIDAFCAGTITAAQCSELRRSISNTLVDIGETLEEYKEQKREADKELKELSTLVEDMKNDRKPYPPILKEARGALERRLSDLYGRTVKVYIFADMFDVRDKEWKNAIEGRMGRLKLSLVTEPKYAHDAAEAFREMKKYEEIDLLHTDAIVKSAPTAEVNSLYEAVETTYPYIDACLKRYLGRTIKCHSIAELEQVRDGVTPECYSYSNFIFRHLRKRDYDKYACIGSRVSKARLEEYQAELFRLEEESAKRALAISSLGKASEFERLTEEDAYIETLSAADKELKKVTGRINTLKRDIEALTQGKYKELQERSQRLEEKKREKQTQLDASQSLINELERRKGHLEGELENNLATLDERRMGYIADAALEAEVEQLLRSRSGQSIRSQKNSEIASLEEKEQQELESRQAARNRFNREYPSVGFSGAERSNDVYVKLLTEYETDYEPKYESEFEKQCGIIYKSLRENVIATIHGDINAAKRHTQEINRLLRKTNFADSTYQIKIEPAKNENGQFYEMLTAPELDSKNIGIGLTQGQLSLGEDEFYQKYETMIKLLTDKFMPIKEEDGARREQRMREMEQYADYRNYLSFSMYEQVTDEQGSVIRENYVDEMAGRDSGGEGQNPKYVALLAGFAMLYMQQSNRDSKIKLVLLDEAFSKMDQERSAVCLQYARKLDLQLIVCVPDERLQSLIRNVDCVYGFRRHQNQISMMHIDKGQYLELLEGNNSENKEQK